MTGDMTTTFAPTSSASAVKSVAPTVDFENYLRKYYTTNKIL